MIKNIKTSYGDTYSYDTESMIVYKNGKPTKDQPIFSGGSSSRVPKFAGIYLESTQSMLSLSGVISKLIDEEAIS